MLSKEKRDTCIQKINPLGVVGFNYTDKRITQTHSNMGDEVAMTTFSDVADN